MMDLANQMAAEVGVFFNPAEFAQPMTVEGLPVLGLWEDREQDSVTAPDAWGVNAVTRLLYLVPDMSMPGFHPQQDITVEGTVWTVRDVADQSGVVRLTLIRHEV